MAHWIDACGAGDIDLEDVMRIDHGGKVYALYRDADGAFFATAGNCTHENVSLADGLVMQDTIECPKHNGRFNYKTGKALRAPACIDLKTYPVRVHAGRVEIDLG
jgi:3-phenylpropionate/trans-cinnamate dioxygenase ferredoxin component